MAKITIIKVPTAEGRCEWEKNFFRESYDITLSHNVITKFNSNLSIMAGQVNYLLAKLIEDYDEEIGQDAAHDYRGKSTSVAKCKALFEQHGIGAYNRLVVDGFELKTIGVSVYICEGKANGDDLGNIEIKFIRPDLRLDLSNDEERAEAVVLNFHLKCDNGYERGKTLLDFR